MNKWMFGVFDIGGYSHKVLGEHGTSRCGLFGRLQSKRCAWWLVQRHEVLAVQNGPIKIMDNTADSSKLIQTEYIVSSIIVILTDSRLMVER